MLYEYMTTAATLQKKTYIYISPCEIPRKVRTYCIHHPFTLSDMYGYVLFKMMIIWVKDSFIHMFALYFVHSCVFIFFFHIVFLIVLLIGIFCEFSVFILQIVSTFLGVAGSGFWAMFVVQQTNRLMQPLMYIYIHMYII